MRFSIDTSNQTGKIIITKFEIMKLGKHLYRFYGLKFQSDFEFPDLMQKDFASPDVQIKIGNNPIHLPVIEKRGVLFETSINDFLFRLSSVGSYRVQNGNLITVDPNSKATISEISLFLFGSAMGALLHQRGILPLHGSSIKTNHEAISFIGNSSVGKSSLAAGFANEGFSVLSDDISAITINKHKRYIVQPGLPYLKLWDDVLKYMKSSENLAQVRPDINKYIKPLELTFCENPVKLGMIICLERKNSLGFDHQVVTGAEKFNLIRKHTYRHRFIDGELNLHRYFNQITELSDQIRLYKVLRPASPLMINELVNYIKEYVIGIE